MNLSRKAIRALVSVLLVLVISACQFQLGQLLPSPAAPTETQAIAMPSPMPATPTTTPTSVPETSTPEPTVTEQVPEAIPQNLIRGLRITLVHPWVNAAGEAFESLITEFNNSNELGIEVISRRAGGYEALFDSLVEGPIRDHLVLTRGFDLAGADDGTTWINLSDAPGIEGITQTLEPCSNCAEYLDQTNLERYITLLYQPALLYYNQTWARELGFNEPPRTPQGLREQLLAAATSKINDGDFDNNGIGGLWLSMSPQSTLGWYRAFGGSFDSADVLPVFARKPIEASFNYLKDLRGSGGSWQSQNPNPYQQFANRSALVYEGTLEDLQSQEVAFDIAQSADEWITLPYPTGDGRGSISMETIGISIRPTYDRVETSSAYFVRWLLEPEQLGKLAEVTGFWPARGNPDQLAPEYAAAHPAWASALSPTVKLTLVPETKNWGFSRLILQDATLRLYSLDAEFIPTILDTLDATLVEAGSAR